MARLAAFVVLLLLATYVVWPEISWQGGTSAAVPGDPGSRALPAAYRAPASLDVPAQMDGRDLPTILYEDARLVPRAVYHIEARVLSTERYRFDSGADVSPIDLLLGWGPMADDQVLRQFSFRQSGRFGFWSWDGPLPIAESLVGRSISNHHLIPASPQVDRALRGLRRDQQVIISGMLVDVHHPDGSVWKTSLKRTDRGAGACEILFATRVSPI